MSQYKKDKTNVIKVRVSDRELDYLYYICQKTGKNKSEIIRELINEKRRELMMCETYIPFNETS